MTCAEVAPSEEHDISGKAHSARKSMFKGNHIRGCELVVA